MLSRDARLTERAAMLQASPLFTDLHAEEIALLAELCQEVSYASGEVIFYEEERGDSLYIVKSGQVEVLYRLDRQDVKEQAIAELGAGEFFGEMSMLEKSTRSATVRAMCESQLLVLTTEDFYSFAKIFRNGFTVVVINIARMLSQRLRQTTVRLKGLS